MSELVEVRLSVPVREEVEDLGATFLSVGFETSRFSAVVGVLALL